MSHHTVSLSLKIRLQSSFPIIVARKGSFTKYEFFII